MNTKRIRRRKPSSTPVVLSIMAVLYLFGLFGLFLFAADKMVDYLKEHVQITVYFNLNTPLEQQSQTLKTISQWPEIAEANYISPEDAAASFKEDLGDNFADIIGNNPLPGSIQVFLKSEYGNERSLRKISRNLELLGGVYEVISQQELVHSIEKNRKVGAMVLLGLLALFSIIAILLINNTVRLAVYSKRFIIRSMQLVGATEWFITKPFIFSAMWHAVLGAILAAVLYFSTAYLIGNWMQYFIFSNEVQFFSMEQLKGDWPFYAGLLGLSLIAGALIAGISTYISTRKYIYSSIDDLY